MVWYSSESSGPLIRAGNHLHHALTAIDTSVQVVSVTELKPSSSSRRRRHQPRLDGPFPLQPGEHGLRSQQTIGSLLLKDSGVSPAAYDGLIKKDVCLTRAPTPKVCT